MKQWTNLNSKHNLGCKAQGRVYTPGNIFIYNNECTQSIVFYKPSNCYNNPGVPFNSQWQSIVK